MNFKQLIFLLLFGFWAVTFGHPFHQDEKEALGVSDPPPTVQNPQEIINSIGNVVKRSDLVRRTENHFAMNGPTQYITIQDGNDVLWTDNLGGCSVVIIASRKYAFAVHVARGSLGTDAHGQVVHMNNQDQMATTAAKNLMALYDQHRAQAGEVKAIVLTADQGGHDSVLTALWNELSTIDKKSYTTYDAMAIFQMPPGDAKTRAGTLQIRGVGGKKMPKVYLGDFPLQWPS